MRVGLTGRKCGVGFVLCHGVVLQNIQQLKHSSMLYADSTISKCFGKLGNNLSYLVLQRSLSIHISKPEDIVFLFYLIRSEPKSLNVLIYNRTCGLRY